MTIIGILHLPTVANPPGAPQSAGTILMSQVSDRYPAGSHGSYHFDHRLFISSSSLPPLDATNRTHTHIFTSSHTAQKTYVGTSPPPSATSAIDTATATSKNVSTITIPTGTSLEPFTALMMQKFGPLWASRQFVITENGSSMMLPLADNGKWRISIADLRVSSSRANGTSVGQSRGVIIEIQYQNDSSIPSVFETEADRKRYDSLFRTLLKSLFKDVKRDYKLDLKLDDAKIHIGEAPSWVVVDKSDGDHEVQGEPNHQPELLQSKLGCYEIPELYMETLRGSRG